MVCAGLRDGEARVRGQAAFALGQLAAHCQPEAGRAAREALPAVIGLMRDQDATVQQQACYALEALCEHMGALAGIPISRRIRASCRTRSSARGTHGTAAAGVLLMHGWYAKVQGLACSVLEAPETQLGRNVGSTMFVWCLLAEEEVAEFLEPLMGHLGAVLAGGGPDTQHSAISAVASAAEAAGNAFARYVPGVLPHLRRYMDLTQARPVQAYPNRERTIGSPPHCRAPWSTAHFISQV